MTPGTQLAHYEVISAIGEDGLGEVWKARATKLGREVATKTLPPEFGRSEAHLARFRREARAASALNHPNICTVHDLGEHEEQPFIVMELLEGETLQAKLERGALWMKYWTSQKRLRLSHSYHSAESGRYLFVQQRLVFQRSQSRKKGIHQSGPDLFTP